MELLTEEMRRLLPPLYTNDERSPSAVKVPLKIFDPGGRYTYYATEYDGEDTLYGFCVSPFGSDCDEFGYSSLSEMQSVTNRFGAALQRDIYWNPDTTLLQLQNGERR